MDHICPNFEKSLVCQPIAFLDPEAVYISEKKKKKTNQNFFPLNI